MGDNRDVSMLCVECRAEPGSSLGLMELGLVLARLDVDGEPMSADLRLAKPVILSIPPLKPECFFLMTWDGKADAPEFAGTVDEQAETVCLSRYSLEEQEVGAVDCDIMDSCFGSDDAVVAETEDVLFCGTRAIISNDTPSAWASLRRESSRSSSVMVG